MCTLLIACNIIKVNICHTDAVVRTSYYKYYHPKEALVANGVLNRAVASAAGKSFPTGSEDGNNLQ